MNAYPMSSIKIESSYCVNRVLKFSMIGKVNHHGRVRYSGIIAKDQADNIICGIKQNAVKIYIADKLEFSGYVDEFSISTDQQDLYRLDVGAISHSKKIDIDERKRFFQNTTRSFLDIIRESFDDSGLGAELTGSSGKRSIDSPILQYCETDWEFTLRMAGLNRVAVLPNLLADNPHICFGMPNRASVDESELLNFKRIRKDEFLPQKLVFSNENRSTNISYTADKCDNHYYLGDSISIHGRPFYVVSKEWLQQEEYISPHYIFAGQDTVSLPSHRNKTITGLELEGTVLAVEPLTLKVKLDIDRKRNYGENSWFAFAPNTNNAMYSMPLVDEKVTLQWQSDWDGDILVTRSVRRLNQELPAPSNKYFQNEFPSHLSMVPASVNFVSPQNQMSLILSSGALFSTEGSIAVCASRNVTLSAKNIKIGSPEQLTFSNRRHTPDWNRLWMGSREIHICSDVVNVESDTSGKQIMPPSFAPVSNFLIMTNKALKIMANQPIRTSAK